MTSRVPNFANHVAKSIKAVSECHGIGAEKHLPAVIMLQMWCKRHRQRQDILSKAQLGSMIWRECLTDHRRISQLCIHYLIAEPLHICYLKKVIPTAAQWGLPVHESSYLPKKQTVVGAHVTIYAHSSNALLCLRLALYALAGKCDACNIIPVTMLGQWLQVRSFTHVPFLGRE